MGKSERIRHEFCLRLTTPNVWLISVKKLVFPFTDLLSGVQPLGWPCLPIVGMEVDRKWKVVLGGSVMLRNENKTLARVFDELSESLEHRENYSVETLA